MKIREASSTDLKSLAQSMESLVKYSQAKLKDPYIDHIDTDHENTVIPWFAEAVNNPNSVVYIADGENTTAGFAAGKLEKPFVISKTIDQIGHIEVCWVDPDYRGKGLSRLLTSELEAWFKRRGVEFIDIYYLAVNEEAKQAWSRLGFEPFRIASRKKI